MKILKECNLSEIINELFVGKTLVFPTETSYGLGCDATNQKAVDKIFKIKSRSGGKSLLIVVPSVEMAKKFLAWNSNIEDLATKYWPGPLTIVGEVVKNSGLAKGVVSIHNTVAVRVTANETMKFLTESLGKPLVATSANISGAGDVYSAEEAVAMFATADTQPDFILDGGKLPSHLPTTIVDVSQNKLEILRQGELEIKN